MTNPTSYTDEQVLELIELCSKGPTQAGVRHMGVSAVLRSLLADRQRLQAEVDAFKADVRKRIEFLEPPMILTAAKCEYWKAGARAVIREVNAALLTFRATSNETKEAKP